MSTIKKVCPKPRVKPRTSISRRNDGPLLMQRLGAYKISDNQWKSTYSWPKSTFG
ncbi:S2-RNase [Pyrus ussuriensis x Pyrus communis]|uniref:S2-RNase n=1 Tax=Pyrus ussuriensis x Pyrus communis TaxID=2448454 RepID=A0A5N5FV98_9ROSA|nr:S2-RNase [Pyrus ussuriensis x Pyrus communis]